jgi:hypothetical protein
MGFEVEYLKMEEQSPTPNLPDRNQSATTKQQNKKRIIETK